MKEYGKWSPCEIGPRWLGRWTYGIGREVKVERWPFGFHWKRVYQETRPTNSGIDRFRLCRVLNGEPEPEVKLHDRRPYTQLGVQGFTQGDYRFSTEELKAELERRAKEPQIVANWGFVTADTPKPKKRRKRK